MNSSKQSFSVEMRLNKIEWEETIFTVHEWEWTIESKWYLQCTNESNWYCDMHFLIVKQEMTEKIVDFNMWET